MRKIVFNSFLLVVVSLLALSCSKTPGNGTKEDTVDIKFNIGFGVYGSITNDNGTAQERVIQRIRILAFSDTGLLDIQVYDEDNSVIGFPIIPLNINMTVQSGQKILCAVANEPPAMKATLDGITTFSDLMALSIGDETTYNLPGAVLPFTHITYVRAVPSQTVPLAMGLKRGVGKVQLDIIKEASNTKTVYMKSTQIIRTPTKSILMRDNSTPLTHLGVLTTLTTANYTVANEVQSAVGSELIMAPKYLFEHYEGLGAAAADKATSIKLELDDNGVIRFYEIPLIGNYSNGSPVYEVVRNTIANVHATVYDNGQLKVDYELLPWGEVNPFDKEPGDNDSNILFTSWIEETVYDIILPNI